MYKADHSPSLDILLLLVFFPPCPCWQCDLFFGGRGGGGEGPVPEVEGPVVEPN